MIEYKKNKKLIRIWKERAINMSDIITNFLLNPKLKRATVIQITRLAI
jgi:hypothetical protein